MAADSDTHPPADVLRGFGLGKLADDASASVLSHLERCPACRREVASLSGDSFLERLRAAQGPGSTPMPDKPLGELPRQTIATTGRPLIPDLPPELADHPQYEVVRELGRGGMGVVYLARNRRLDRLEVLKVMGRELLNQPGARQRFEREMRSAARLNHPNVVAAYSVLELDSLLVLAMEYVEGEDLAKVVKARGRLPVANACYCAYQAALGLQHALDKGMVHRDIKPQNLILTRDGKRHVVKVLDLGLAKATREEGGQYDLTGEGKMLGTPHYIATEQIRDAATADIRSDVYSLGCTLYCLLAGEPPFTGGSLYALLHAHQEREARPLDEVRPDVPEGLAAVVRRMMAKEPAQRYQTPGEVARALVPFFKPAAATEPEPRPAAVTAAGGGWETLTEPATPPAPAARPVKQRRRLIGVVALAGAVLAALAGLWAGGVFKVKTGKGTLVLWVNEPNAEVEVDGGKMTVTWQDGGKKAEIELAPGRHEVRVTKGELVAEGETVTIAEGGREVLRATLKWDAPRPAAPAGAAAKEDGFVSVFNGKDLPGWFVESGENSAWRFGAGELVASGRPPRGADHMNQGYLLSTKEYADFTMRFEFLLSNDAALSGIALRAVPNDPTYEPSFPYHLTLMLGSLKGPRWALAGSLWWAQNSGVQPLKVPTRTATITPGEWAEAEIELRGPALRVTVNGSEVQAVRFDRVGPFKGPTAGLTRKSGRIGFLQRTNEIRFRNVRIRELGPADGTRPTRDALQVGSAWTGTCEHHHVGVPVLIGKVRITVLNRSADKFIAQCDVDDGTRISTISGTVSESGEIIWRWIDASSKNSKDRRKSVLEGKGLGSVSGTALELKYVWKDYPKPGDIDSGQMHLKLNTGP